MWHSRANFCEDRRRQRASERDGYSNSEFQDVKILSADRKSAASQDVGGSHDAALRRLPTGDQDGARSRGAAMLLRRPLPRAMEAPARPLPLRAEAARVRRCVRRRRCANDRERGCRRSFLYDGFTTLLITAVVAKKPLAIASDSPDLRVAQYARACGRVSAGGDLDKRPVNRPRNGRQPEANRRTPPNGGRDLKQRRTGLFWSLSALQRPALPKEACLSCRACGGNSPSKRWPLARLRRSI
jgi:hypothetical protein